jgi:RNA polymerase sigma factor (sigma-70 family)
MAAGQMNKAIEHVRSILAKQDVAGMTDGDLVERYLHRQDETAFEALMQRHGPMVMGVCRRVLGNSHDAEDAFQATFLLLVRKGASLRSPGLVGNWLYGVAHRTALEAKRMALKRRIREAAVTPRPETLEDFWADLRPVLDRELERLPTKYRAVLVLCDIEGKTRKDAARQLGWAEGTVASRLAGARSILTKRLAPYRLAVSAGALAEMLSQHASASIPATVASATIRAAFAWAAGPTAASAAISAEVAALTTGVLRTMWLMKLKVLGMAFLLVCLLGAGVIAGIIGQTRAAEPVEQLAEKKTAGRANPTPAKAEPSKENARWTNLQRRLAGLQKQIEVLTAEVQALRKELQPRKTRPAPKAEIKIFPLKYAKANEVRETLRELFPGPSEKSPDAGIQVRIATHASTNSILAQGRDEDLMVLESIISRLDQPSADSKKPKQGK